ncbi:hypothetical protein TRICHSKD4_4957 [Roseibium sp. TrichSKD4]|uniref:hypothetical protein n=1 Tax=Roseibium sp. TrichSKD4 TaxID=744980 RepID=UPI0001E57336|nr:hypothetical protein [Roseibium sp. TrichSKD4]EFO29142.1 hypothetical protein TRICHSKD4_4957 [Roseibium sp. TrichSKD4]
MSAVFPIEDKPRYGRFVATAGQTIFAIPFEFQQNRDVKVRRTPVANGVPTLLAEGVNYTMAGAGVYNGGSFVLIDPASEGDVFEVWGDAVLDRTSSIVQAGKFRSKPNDDEHDRHRIIQQELKREAERAIRGPMGMKAPEIIGEPTPDRTLMFDNDGNIIVGPNAGDVAGANQAAQTAVTAAETVQLAKQNVLDLEEKARRWASETPGTEVSDGEYSAKHYAEIARQLVEKPLIFYGLRRGDNHLIFDVGAGNFVSQNYRWWDLKSPGINFSIDANGHLIAEIM